MFVGEIPLQVPQVRGLPKGTEGFYPSSLEKGSRSVALLTVFGVDIFGTRSVLGVSVSLSEAEVHWRDLLSSLLVRGLTGVRFIVSDAHEGLKAARQAVFPGAIWQRSQFHLQQNAAAYLPSMEMRKEVAKALRDIFNAPDRHAANALLKDKVIKYSESAPKLATWMEENLPEGLAVFALPEIQCKRMRTSNMAERVNKDLKRRTRVVSLFPNEASLLALASAMLVEIDEGWATKKSYLNINEV